MGFFNSFRGIRGIVQLLIIHLFCWLAWSVSFCLAQFDISEGVTGSVNFPALGITCVGNLAVFVTTLIRGRLDLEIGARDVLAILGGPKLKNINGMNGDGLTTCMYDVQITPQRLQNVQIAPQRLHDASVVMLSRGTPNSSMREFVKSNAPIVDSILLHFLPLGDAVVTIEACECKGCRCIVFWTTKSITVMLARRIPGILKQLSDSLCLLPCLTCLKNGCHGGNDGLLYTVEGDELTEDNSIVESRAEAHVVCKILEDIGAGEPICICIPMNDSRRDNWTELLIRSFRSRDAEGRGVRVMASEALEGYLAGGREGTEGSVEYNLASFIVPRLTEILINLVLTGWFMVDGFSSSLLARRTIKDYIVDSKGSGFAANAFLTKAVVKSDANNSCQLLTFRGNLLGFRTVSFTVGCVNMLCSIFWVVFIAFDGGADSSAPPSMARVAVIMAAIGIALGMDFAMSLAAMSPRREECLGAVIFMLCPWTMPCFLGRDWRCNMWAGSALLSLAMIYLEIICILSGSMVAGTLGIKAFGKWIYAALQILVWLKWGLGSAFLLRDIDGEFFGKTPSTWKSLTYSSAFLINAVLAGVRSTWGPWLWKGNHLWSRKVLH